jgi:hypothetical protein
MAINVDTVYKTVLLILNKEQRGYLTPDEFNKTATQVQLEIFNEYFEGLNQQLRVPDNDSEYADRIKNIDSEMAVFKTIDNCTQTPGSNIAILPTSSGLSVFSELITTTAGVQSYYLSTLTQAQLQNGIVKVYIRTGSIDTLQPPTFYSIIGQTIYLTSNPGGAIQLVITVDVNDFYRLGTVIYNDEIEVQRIQRNDLLYINKSPLTKPTLKYPVYLYEDSHLILYPTSIDTGISVSYVRKPKDVIWNFTATALSNYTYVYDPSSSTSFELSPTEQTNVITRILLYSGVIVNDPEIVQVAAQQIQLEQINSKS